MALKSHRRKGYATTTRARQRSLPAMARARSIARWLYRLFSRHISRPHRKLVCRVRSHVADTAVIIIDCTSGIHDNIHDVKAQPCGPFKNKANSAAWEKLRNQMSLDSEFSMIGF